MKDQHKLSVRQAIQLKDPVAWPSSPMLRGFSHPMGSVKLVKSIWPSRLLTPSLFGEFYSRS